MWSNEYSHNGKRIVQFLDKKLRQEEETNFLENIEKEKKNIEDYNKSKAQFGVMSIITNTDLSARKIYNLYKKRVEIEVAFDIWKNNLESDKTYMRSNEHIRGYFFITFLSLHLYCQIINYLREKELLNKYSVQDILLLLSKIYSVRLDNKEITAEIPKRTRTLLTKLELPIT
ncbi:MAG: transposase [Candidatus Woesearchaeota archaeon]